VWTFAGLRPLLADPKDRATSVTRDYVLDLNTDGAPLLSIYGGKLTTYRKLAEDVVDTLAPRLGCTARAWTAGQPLPGGDMPRADFDAFVRDLTARYRDLPSNLLYRYARAYGTRVERILAGASSTADLGEEVLPGLYAREIDYLRREEFAMTAEDILYRRSKLALHVPADGAARLERWLQAHTAAAT
jgi:glycerol-3-phosphate dehydrogenase